MMQFKHSVSVMRKQLGLTLIEALSFLAIFGVVAAGAVSMFQTTSDAAQVNMLANEVHGIKAAVKARALSGTAYSTITMQTLKDSGALSTNFKSVTADATPKGVLANGTEFAVTGAASEFSIVVSNLSDENCTGLIQSLASSGATNTLACSSGSATFTYK